MRKHRTSPRTPAKVRRRNVRLASHAKDADSGHTKVHVSFHEFTLQNGLTVILRREPSVPVVAVNVAYHVGSKNELRGKTGFAHLFEHLMFEGSENVKKGEFDTYISLAGGYNNAYTTEDLTNYYDVLPSNQLSLALWLESDRMFRFKVTEEALKTQREVVKEEKRWRVDNRPYGDATEQLQKMVFPVGQYNWPVIGSMEDLDAAKMEDVVGFFDRHYTPSNAVLSISGDIDLDDSERLVNHYFSEMPKSSAAVTAVAFEDRRLDGENVVHLSGNVPAPALFIAYKAPREGTPEYYALSQIGKVLSDGNSSRLYRKLVYELQAVSDFDASVDGMENASVFLFSAFLTPGHTIEELTKLFDEEINAIQSSMLGEYEFAKARNSTISGYVGRLSTNSGVADSLAHCRVFFEDTAMINTEVERELAVTRESVMNAARQYLRKESRAVIHYTPIDSPA